MTTRASWVGQTLKDTYHIDQKIGEGGTGLVFRGLHLRLKVPIAIKILKQNTGDLAFARFRKEAEITARLRHPNIVQVLDYDVTPDGYAYLVTEWLEGDTLSAYLKQHGAVPAETAVAILRPVCEAVAAAHAAGVVHRDLKPANLFLGEAPVIGQTGAPLVKVLDFGIAKLTELDPVRTEQGQTVGTPRYMSPEQIKVEGEDELSPASDQFSLGAIAYELVAGRPAFPGSAHAAMLAVLEGRSDPLPPSVPAGYRAAVARAMAPRSEDRFPTVRDFMQALQRSLTEPEEATPAPRPWPQGWMFAAAALFGASLAVILLVQRNDGRADGRHGALTIREASGGGPTQASPQGADLGVVVTALPRQGQGQGNGEARQDGGDAPAPAGGEPASGATIEVRPRGLPEGAQLFVEGRQVSARHLLLPVGARVRLKVVPPARSCLKKQEITYTAGPGRLPPAFHLVRDRDCPFF
jgi:hypothetical protein